MKVRLCEDIIVLL